MDLKRKIEIVEQSVRSISEHRDEDAAVRQAALARIHEIATAERAKIDAEVLARIEQSVG